MRILFLGDIVGGASVDMVVRLVPPLKAGGRIDAVIANAENAAAGSGLASSQFRALTQAGVDLLTLGDHALRKREIVPILENDRRICRPANLAPRCPGNDLAVTTLPGGIRLAAFCVLGRTFMKPAECPLEAIDRLLARAESEADIVVADLHAEATAEKLLLGRHLDGKVAAALGTHTHVPTADHCLLPLGTAYQTDVGMCGPHDGVLGRQTEAVLRTTRSGLSEPWPLATGDLRLNGAIVEIELGKRRATAIEPFSAREP
ncbi:MAG: YmdB family metallophosphoesterase [Planctomycetota bacterium]